MRGTSLIHAYCVSVPLWISLYSMAVTTSEPSFLSEIFHRIQNSDSKLLCEFNIVESHPDA